MNFRVLSFVSSAVGYGPPSTWMDRYWILDTGDLWTPLMWRYWSPRQFFIDWIDLCLNHDVSSARPNCRCLWWSPRLLFKVPASALIPYAPLPGSSGLQYSHLGLRIKLEPPIVNSGDSYLRLACDGEVRRERQIERQVKVISPRGTSPGKTTEKSVFFSECTYPLRSM